MNIVFEKPRVAVLAGGGSYGASQAGSLLGMKDRGEAVDYSHFYCISVGAMNGGFLSQFETTADGILPLVDLWNGLTGSESVYKNDWRYLIPHLRYFLGNSRFITTPQRALIEKNFDSSRLKSSGKSVRLGAINDSSGEYVEATENSKDLVSWIMASSAFPEAFPPVEIDGMLHSDGGLRNIIPLRSAIEDNHTRIDIFLNGSLAKVPFMTKSMLKKFKARVLRRFQIMISEIWRNDIDFCKVALEKNNDLDIRVFGHDLVFHFDPLDFSPENVRYMIHQARKRTWISLHDFLKSFSNRIITS